MGRLQVDERKAVEENVFKYEERMNSPVTRLQEETPIFVTYYHIDADETTTDAGYEDVASIIGHRSPIKFNKIDGLPIYGIDPVLPQIEDLDQGLDTTYQGEAKVAPRTIIPSPNDFFVIPYLKYPAIFRVTEVLPDHMRPDNFYKFNYQLEYIEEEKIEGLESQTREKYTCLLENVGSDRRCIIQSEYLDTIKQIDEMFDDIAHTYMQIYYSERHNCMLGEMYPGIRLYDPFQTVFVNKHGLFNKKNDLRTYMFTDQYNDPKARIKYEKSVYRCVEKREKKLVTTFDFVTMNGKSIEESSFHAYAEEGCLILDMPSLVNGQDIHQIFSPEFAAAVKMNGPTETKYAELLKKWIRNEEVTIYDIPLTLTEELLDLDANLEMFFVVPILMYIIKEVVNDFMHDETALTVDHLDVE